MKGYELYSWSSGSEWRFTLITGTNRLKTYEEITAGEETLIENGWVKIRVQGVESLKAVLSQLPSGEEVFWMGPKRVEQAPGMEGNWGVPSQEMVDEIAAYCQALGIALHRVE
jgi:hypothetical protein